MAKGNGKNTAETVRELIEPTVNAMCYDLWDVEFVKEGAEWILRITIDSPDGIGIEDCEAVARTVDPMLDEADPIDSSYRMEVSSPGLDRTLRTPAHFLACIGEEAEIKLFRAIDGSKSVRGILRDYDVESKKVSIEVGTEEGGAVVEIEGDNIAGAKLVFEF